MKKLLCLLVLIAGVIALFLVNAGIPKQGYYVYRPTDADETGAWYHMNAVWYHCLPDEEGDLQWVKASAAPEDLTAHWKQYYLGLRYPQDAVWPDLSDSDVYREYERTYINIPQATAH